MRPTGQEAPNPPNRSRANAACDNPIQNCRGWLTNLCEAGLLPRASHPSRRTPLYVIH
jgi:hypothetical protein